MCTRVVTVRLVRASIEGQWPRCSVLQGAEMAALLLMHYPNCICCAVPGVHDVHRLRLGAEGHQGVPGQREAAEAGQWQRLWLSAAAMNKQPLGRTAMLGVLERD